MLAWVVYLDAYGFGDLSARENARHLYDRLAKCWRKAHERVLKNHAGPNTFFAFSDCAFLVYQFRRNNKKSKVEALKTCLEEVALIMDTFMSSDLILRGGIACGEIASGDNILVGHPVTRAASYESSMSIPCVILPEYEFKEIKDELMEDAHDLRIKPIKLKNAEMTRGIVVLPYQENQFLNQARQKWEHYSLNGPFKVAKIWYETMGYLEEADGDDE